MTIKDALTSNDLAGAIPEDFVGAVNKNAKFAPGDVAYCRTFACNARVMSVGTTKSGICNYKVALYDAKGVRTGEAVCSESDLVRRSVRGMKLTGLASGASRACDVAATILEKMVQRNKVDLPLAKKVLRLTQRDFPDARVSVAAAKLNENPPALLSAAKILRAEANRLRAQGKSIKAMRAAVKRAPAEALPLIAPLHSKLLMIYRKFIGDPEGASLGSLPALAAQWKAAGNKLPDEEQSGVALIVRDLISAYRSFTKEQVKNTAYFLAMALGTANKMVGGSANVPIPAHLRSVKAIDAKEYYEKNKVIPVGSILRVNGKLVQVERANGYVISGYEYKKPQSTNTHVSVDLRNTPATLLSVGNGTFRFARDGNVVFGRRPARSASKSRVLAKQVLPKVLFIKTRWEQLKGSVFAAPEENKQQVMRLFNVAKPVLEEAVQAAQRSDMPNAGMNEQRKVQLWSAGALGFFRHILRALGGDNDPDMIKAYSDALIAHLDTVAKSLSKIAATE